MISRDPPHPPHDDGCVAPGGDSLADILCDRALFGLDDRERVALHRMLAVRGGVDDGSFDLVAAQLDQALHPLSADAAMPAAVMARCIERVERLAEPAAVAGTIRPAQPVGSRAAARAPLAPAAASGGASGSKVAAGWSAAGSFGWAAGWAAAVLFCAALVFSLSRNASVPADRPQVSAAAPVIAMRKTEDPLCAAASGEIVWDEEAQRGRLVVTGLEPNDPTRLQYQLWIFDATRDERFPVDGGLFDVPTSGRVVLDVRPPVPIREPALFAVTVEPPGGSVVSERRIVLVGKRSG